jgi:hypothetical protein
VPPKRAAVLALCIPALLMSACGSAASTSTTTTPAQLSPAKYAERQRLLAYYGAYKTPSRRLRTRPPTQLTINALGGY